MAESQEDQPDPWNFRASDADRESYLSLLREAYAEGRLDAAEYEERMGAALAGKSYRDLYAVLSELPIDPDKVPGPPVRSDGNAVAGRYLPVAAPGRYPSPIAGNSQDNSVLAILSSSNRTGPWLVPAELTAVSVLGEVTLDLSNAVLTSARTVIRCNTVLGSVIVIVPDALHVDMDGNGILGTFETKDKRKRTDRARTPAPDAPHVRITGVAVLGSVEVKLVVPKGKGVTMLEGGPHRHELPGPPEPGQPSAGPDG